eukprot:TRINITY_DN23366_c0_g1_i1.p1 TRINITY_DN23366_c0_g1~~TRINITY_DN23366_c0_g1_i1.p1  ORF type:complete len:451 (-),score=103.01 TRINITY_DN23366_c0_g1_i1:34-1386(-)
MIPDTLTTNNQVTLTWTPERPVLPVEGADVFDIITSLKAPFFEETNRAPIQIVAVIDRSGSMQGDKIELVKETLKFVAKQLHDKDNLSIVIYDNEVDTILDPTNMDSQGKERAQMVISKIFVRGGTDLCAGLLRGLDVIQGNPINEVASVLLFTDGHVNAGISNTDAIIAEVAKKEKEGKLGCTVHTFGFGPDHALSILKEIAEKGAGSYFFIQNKDTIADAFVNCLGGLLSVVAQNITLSIEGDNGAGLHSVVTAFKQTSASNGWTVHIGDIQSEEERDILCRLKVPPHPDGEALEVLKLKLCYFNVISSKQEEIEKVVSLRASLDYPNSSPSVKVSVQKNRIATTEALTRAKAEADKGDYASARKILNETITQLQQSISASDPFTEGLIHDLKDSLSGLIDQTSFASYGGYQMSSYTMSHSRQRGTHSTACYSTSSRFALQEELRKNT